MSHAGHFHGAMSGRRLWLSLGITLLFCVGEAVAGHISHSLALISDAGHNVGDALGLGLAAYAVSAMRKPPKGQHTYGFYRVATLTALFNAGTLVIIALAIGMESIARFRHPEPLAGSLMIWVAAVSVLMNTVIAVALSGDAKHSLNSRAAMVHMAGDAISAVGVVLAGVVIRYTGWVYADPLVSILIAGFILWSALGVLRDAVDVLMEKAPSGLDIDAVAETIKRADLVCGLHDLHVWTVGEGRTLLSCHIAFTEGTSLNTCSETIARVASNLRAHFSIQHATIQPEINGTCHAFRTDTLYCEMDAGTLGDATLHRH
jgi:cobalt-zinc-cadmium efflux system protein